MAFFSGWAVDLVSKSVPQNKPLSFRESGQSIFILTAFGQLDIPRHSINDKVNKYKDDYNE
ncbi:hypothetical protein EVU96_20130 [Bacillus infantis]|uniref:hypothetical protein n=1 Tax=Bacillus infantis TaxID=324767 RepID=UPI00101C905D|nr:hypothetical protein [Bacillus infantis]RYI26673.1 hypothetical protein EVU96_20130 [Bacillus infantis]